MLDNRGYRRTFITCNTYFLFDGKNCFANARFTFTRTLHVLIFAAKSLCYCWSYLYSPQQTDTAVAILPLTHIVQLQPLLNLLDLHQCHWPRVRWWNTTTFMSRWVVWITEEEIPWKSWFLCSCTLCGWLGPGPSDDGTCTDWAGNEVWVRSGLH